MMAAAVERLTGGRSVLDLGPAERIPPGEGRTFTIGGLRVAVFRTREGAVHATQADCPHRQGPLADGLLGGGILVCPLHARKWTLATGAPVAGNDCAALITYPVALDADGNMLLSLRADP